MSAIAVAVGTGVAGIAGAAISAHAAGDAADKQAAAANYAADLQNNQYQQTRTDNAPYRAAAQGALSQMQDPSFQHSFGMSDFQSDPGYQFRLQQGQDALERSAAARGGLQTGGTLKSLNDYAQGSASQEYQNAYNRFTNDQSGRFNRLASLAGLGQTANGQVSASGMNAANVAGEAMMGGANARGAAGIAGANAMGGAISGIGNTAMQGAMMGRLFPGAPSPGNYTPMDYSNPQTGYAAGPVQANGTYNSADAYTPAMPLE